MHGLRSLLETLTINCPEDIQGHAYTLDYCIVTKSPYGAMLNS